MKWSSNRIGDVCAVGDGAHAKITRRSSGVEYLTSKNIKTGKLDWSNIDYISEQDFKKYCNKDSDTIKRPLGGDVLLCIIGASIGDSCFVPEDPKAGLSSSVAIVRAKQDIIFPKYLYYWTRGYIFQDAIRRTKSGSAQGFLSLSMIKSLPVDFPELSGQEKIAKTLSAYDDLIENNDRRIALLEESVHLLYREWFVNLRFPGGRGDGRAINDGIPEGWEELTIEQAFQITGGGTPSKKVSEYWQDGDVTWYSPSDLTKANLMFMEQSSAQITRYGLNKSSARLFPAFSVMMTSRATIGAISINTTEACTNQGFITCMPNERVTLYFLYCWLTDNVENFKNLASGATFKEISKGVFKKIPILIPSQKVVRDFEERIQLTGECILNLQRQNEKLREARDGLLPRLMNGSIAV